MGAAAPGTVSDVKFIDEFFYAQVMMLSYALEDAGKSFHLDWAVHRDNFMMFPVALRSDARMGTAAANDFVT